MGGRHTKRGGGVLSSVGTIMKATVTASPARRRCQLACSLQSTPLSGRQLHLRSYAKRMRVQGLRLDRMGSAQGVGLRLET